MTFYNQHGNQIVYPATSGRDGETNPRVRNYGPIPPGEYVLRPEEISEVRGLDYFKRRLTGDWGVISESHFIRSLGQTCLTKKRRTQGRVFHARRPFTGISGLRRCR